ncbi:hypothetical protein DPMN_133439 [Dreissena polymorpha]|uniref:Uncharacterized protein n=1 Tax=Dreissena polymorpha TaxID=45954 RepID=A0A9D4G053_DREPO|nr:hypothetical protein DPMN_133439 [Dreissena polymorpha]
MDSVNKKCVILDERLQRLRTPYTILQLPGCAVFISRVKLALTDDIKTAWLMSVTMPFVLQRRSTHHPKHHLSSHLHAA